MDAKSIQKAVCEAGLKLQAEGLVARTWGNISVRIDANTMAITPSGRKYDDLKPEDIVLVNINDGSWEGSIKPSGERKLHIAIYQQRKEINAVIHTHQLNASTCAAARKNVPVSAEFQSILGTSELISGGYGLPGSKKLTNNSAAAVSGTQNAALMSNHGAVCLGTNIEEAFEAAKTLEKACRKYITDSFKAKTGSDQSNEDAICNYYIHKYGKKR